MEENNTKRNAQVKQDRTRVEKNKHQVFDNLGLTKRNAEYMYRMNKALEGTKLTPEKKTQAINQMVEEILAGQKSGKTARNLYGDVMTKVDVVVNGPQTHELSAQAYWPNAIYNGLLFLLIFNVMFGIMFLFTPSMQNQAGATGIVSIFVSAIAAGLGMPLLQPAFDPKAKHKYSIWIRMLFIIAAFALWVVLFYGTNILPRAINPVIPAWPSIAIGAVAGVGAFYMRSRYKITGGLF